MTTKYYADSSGAYLGAFDGAAPPSGATEVASAPDDARQVWTGSAWAALTDAQRAAGVVLARQDFCVLVECARPSGAGDADVEDWVIANLEASALPAAVKAVYVKRCRTAVQYLRQDAELDGATPGAAMTTLGALFGLSSAQVDSLFLGDAVSIALPDCPIDGPVQSAATRSAAREAQLASLQSLE